MMKNGSNIEAWRGEIIIADSFSAWGTPHGIAPRVYCAANPLRFIDPSGMIVEFETETVPDKIGRLKNQSTFRYLYDYLNDLDYSVYITDHNDDLKDYEGKPINAQYSTGSKTIAFQDLNTCDNLQVYEEFYHAVQDAMPTVEGDETIVNFEYEAKYYSTVSAAYGGVQCAPMVSCLNELYNKIIELDPENSSNPHSITETIKSELKNNYTKTGAQFVADYKGIKHHDVEVSFVPQRLETIFMKVGLLK